MAHYHLIENQVGNPQEYRDEVFTSRRSAMAAARGRAQWLAATAGARVVALAGGGRYLVTTGHPRDAGRIIEVEECDEAGCFETDPRGFR